MYRTEIDGLRALAVLLVLLFHLDVAVFHGGFVGVDVFYVISGYLITRNIMKDGAAFKLTDFFVRRVRRLMPAVWATVAITMAAAIALMAPDAARDAAASAIAAIFSVSNFTFWMESGYWDTSAALKPLLHTWSLGVEEQFYLVWPFLMLLARPLFGRWSLTLMFVGLILAGLLLSQWMLGEDPSAAFYLMPFRIMEFATGAAVTAGEKHLRLPFPKWARVATCAAGIAAVVWSGVAYSGETPFPGIAAMVPALGTAFIIAAGSQPLSAVLFENPISVYVGRISYSLYLTHWPIVSLYKYTTLDPLDWREQLALAAAMLVTGIMLHHGVEKPFRYGQKTHPAYPFALAAVFALAVPVVLVAKPLLSASAAPHAGEQVALNVPMRQARGERLTYGNSCTFESACGHAVAGRLNIYVIGDSHAADGVNALHVVFPDAHIVQASVPGCRPFVGLEGKNDLHSEAGRNCDRLIGDVYADASPVAQADLIVFSNLVRAGFVHALEDSLVAVSRFHKPIIVFGNSPAFKADLPDIVRERHLTPDDAIPAELVDRQYAGRADALVRGAAERNGALYLSIRDFTCPGGRCSAWTAERTRLISYDHHHQSLASAEAFGRARADVIRAAMRRR